jgi:hypothetical protein
VSRNGWVTRERQYLRRCNVSRKGWGRVSWEGQVVVCGLTKKEQGLGAEVE